MVTINKHDDGTTADIKQDKRGNERKRQLEAFLDEIRARRMYIVYEDKTSGLMTYQANGKIFLVFEKHVGDNFGFDIFIPATDSIKIEDTFGAVKEYLER